ncbi:hypothetical protein ABIC33_006537 [Variovorax sp. 1140]|uniref:hypothetical protein n=1 Tax=Variovorax atrisoli TaxID=3394203 RepID=UPI003396ACFD
MKKAKGILVDDSLSEYQEIARVATRTALEAYEVPEGYRDRFTLRTVFEGDIRIFELYVPGEGPSDAALISSARVHVRTRRAEVQVFNLEKRKHC